MLPRFIDYIGWRRTGLKETKQKRTHAQALELFNQFGMKLVVIRQAQAAGGGL